MPGGMLRCRVTGRTRAQIEELAERKELGIREIIRSAVALWWWAEGELRAGARFQIVDQAGEVWPVDWLYQPEVPDEPAQT